MFARLNVGNQRVVLVDVSVKSVRLEQLDVIDELPL
mgnify:CR=1 FL=1